MFSFFIVFPNIFSFTIKILTFGFNWITAKQVKSILGKLAAILPSADLNVGREVYMGLLATHTMILLEK